MKIVINAKKARELMFRFLIERKSKSVDDINYLMLMATLMIVVYQMIVSWYLRDKINLSVIS